MIVKEFGSQRNASGVTFKVRGLQDTVLIGITKRNTVGKIVFDRTVGTDIVFCGNSGSHHFVLPVGVYSRIKVDGCNHGFRCVGVVDDEIAVFVSCHDIYFIFPGADRDIARIVYLHRTCLAFLGSNDDYTIRGTGTVDGGCRRIF